jgi:hypothetical protein
MKRVLTPLKAGTHTQNCEILDGGFYIYTLTWQVIELCTNCYLPTAVLLWPRQLQLKQNPNWPCHVCWGGSNYMFEWELLKFGWNLDEVWMVSSKYVCMFVCLFWVACFECFLSFFLLVLRLEASGMDVIFFHTLLTQRASSRVSKYTYAFIKPH